MVFGLTSTYAISVYGFFSSTSTNDQMYLIQSYQIIVFHDICKMQDMLQLKYLCGIKAILNKQQVCCFLTYNLRNGQVCMKAINFSFKHAQFFFIVKNMLKIEEFFSKALIKCFMQGLLWVSRDTANILFYVWLKYPIIYQLTIDCRFCLILQMIVRR